MYLIVIQMLVLGHVVRKYTVSYNMYADDTQLYMEFYDNEENVTLQSCIQDIQSWLIDNVYFSMTRKRKLSGSQNSTVKNISKSAVHTLILSLVLPALVAHWMSG